MPDQKSKTLSRRDTIKVLAAAVGAGALANLPGKWTKPGLDFGVLPAHAQTSQTVHTLVAGADAQIDNNVEQPPITINSTVQITPPTPGILMRYSIVLDEPQGVNAVRRTAIDIPAESTGTVPTDSTGLGTLPITYSNLWFNSTITVTWSFENSSDGTGTDDQVFSTPTFN